MMVHLYHGSVLNPSVAGIIIVTPSWDAVEILRSFMFPILFSQAPQGINRMNRSVGGLWWQHQKLLISHFSSFHFWQKQDSQYIV